MRRRAWQIVDKWSWNENDHNVAEEWKKERKRAFPTCEVRLFHRTVRGGGAAVPVIVGVVRRAMSVPSFVGLL